MKSQISASKAKATPAEPDKSNTKYLKRSEVEAQRQAAYAAEQEALAAQRREKADKKRKLEEDEAEKKREREQKKLKMAEESRIRREEEEREVERQRRKRLGLPDLPDKSDEKDAEDYVDQEQVTKDLKALGEPTRLSDETDAQRAKRWKQLTEKPIVYTKGPIPTRLELVPEAEMKIPAKAPKDEEAKTFIYRQLASYFTMVLTEWAIAMAGRPAEVKESAQGKTAFNAMVQARDNLKPLFKKFETGDVDESILEAVVEIVHAAQVRRYVDASDAYLRVSIGKA
jgi:pre-mRNA-splicing factor 18